MATFYIIKRVSGWWHIFNNGSKEVNISNFEAVLDNVNQTFIIQNLNGANTPQIPVGILDIIVIDETDASVEETFANVEDLKVRLTALGYTPYLGAGNADSITGLIQEGTGVTITGSGTLADPYVINSSGSTTPTLQEVYDAGGEAFPYGEVRSPSDFSRMTHNMSDDVPLLYKFYADNNDDFSGQKIEIQEGIGLFQVTGNNKTDGKDFQFRIFNGRLLLTTAKDDSFYTYQEVEEPTNTTTIKTPAINADGDYITAVEPISKTASFTAQNGKVYTTNGTLTVTDPTPVANKGYIVHVIGGTATIDGVGYTTGALIYRYYNGSSWLSVNMYQDLSTYATQTYVDNKVAGLLDLRGNYDASTNVFPSSGGSGTAGAILKGDFWYVSVAGTLNGEPVQIGDSIYALVDSPSSAQWEILQANLAYVPEDVANKENTTLDTSTTKYPTNRLVKERIDLKSDIASPTFTGTVTTPAIIVSSETASRVSIIDGSKNVKSADTATYPSLTELAHVKGVTSAIQTQLNARAKKFFLDVTQTTPVTAAANTILATGLVTANTFNSSDVLPVFSWILKTGTANTSTLKLYHNTSNTLTGATQIATNGLGNTQIYCQMQRSFVISGGNLIGLNFSLSAVSDVANSTSGLSSTAFNVAVDNYFFLVVQSAGGTDTFANVMFKGY